jgi:hypothetical protein
MLHPLGSNLQDLIKKEGKIQAWQVWLHLHNKSAGLMNKAPTNNQIQQGRI